MKTIDNPNNLYLLRGQNKHGAIIAMDESGVRILIQSKEHPENHVVLELLEYDDLARFVQKNRKGIMQTILGDEEVVANGT